MAKLQFFSVLRIISTKLFLMPRWENKGKRVRDAAFF